MIRNYLLYVAGYALLVFNCSCNSTFDRSSDVNRTLIKQVDSASDHFLEFSEFTKINGVEKQAGSLKYELTFTARISAKKDCHWDGSISYSQLDQSRIRLGEVTVATDSLKPDFVKKNYGYDIKGTAVFEKKDNGWTLISIYFI